MYRLVLYYLIVLLIAACLFSAIHVLPYNPVALAASSLFLFFFCGFINDLLGKIFKAPTNVESAYISALILALVLSPVKSVEDFLFLGFVAILTMSSKFILAPDKKHIFNPVAIALVITGFGLNHSATWWVGNAVMTPLIIIGGLLVVRKIRREAMVVTYILSAVGLFLVIIFLEGSVIVSAVNKIFLHSSMMFFAFVMLTEPLTTPPTKKLQILYAALTGLFFVPQIHIGTIFTTPELALVMGNVFSYIVSPKLKLMLKLKEKVLIAPDTYDFVFPLKEKINIVPGQFMEWTFAHNHVDSRGNRRYFTLASSPTEDTVRIGVKFYKQASSYKKAMLAANESTAITASQLAGDFTLSKNPQEKYVFIAGGIGITPFRSILKYLIDTNQPRDIVLFYSNKLQSEIVYADVLNEAASKIGTRIICTLTDTSSIRPEWRGAVGRISAELIQKTIPDFAERTFYISGPHTLVTSFETVLNSIHIHKDKIKVDFFPGFV